jgi:hypothetical protein
VATLRVILIVPPSLVKAPLIHTTCKAHRLIPNIRKARITETTGEAILDLSGEEADLKAGVEYLTGLGVKVKPVKA